MTLRITTLSITALNLTTFSITILSIMTPSITSFSIKTLFNNIQYQNNQQMTFSIMNAFVMTLSIMATLYNDNSE
jgi:hypothetical protein